MTGEGSRPFVGHHDRQAGHESDADVVGRKLAVQAFAGQAAFVRHRIHVGGGPIGFQRSLKPSAAQILGAPFAYVGIDELRPQTNEIGSRARADVDVELERRAIAVRRGLCFDPHVHSGSARCQAVEDELRRRLEEAGVGDHGLDRDRIGARPLWAELRVARLEMRRPDPRRVGGRRHPALGVDMSQAGQNLEPVDTIMPRILIPRYGAARLVDEEWRRVGVIDAHASGADGELTGKRAQRRVGREFSVEFDCNRSLRGQRRRRLVERLKIGEAQIMRLDGQGPRIPLRSLRCNCPWSRWTGRGERGACA